LLQAGLSVSQYVHADDTGARHDGKNGYCTHPVIKKSTPNILPIFKLLLRTKSSFF
jgi:hypothetical protein